MKTIRLACCSCDRDDMDGIDDRQLAQAKRDGWTDVQRVQSFTQATRSDSADSAWWTHLGICPECSQVECDGR